MNWTLTNGEDVLVISDGQSRIHRVAENHSGQMSQQTQVDVRLRAAFATAQPNRATRGYSLPLVVSFPACETNEEAYQQSFSVPLSCPRGGVLTGAYKDFLVTFSQAWVESISFHTDGLSNVFTFNLQVVNPVFSTTSTLAQMDARYIANLSAITGLTGGGSENLDGLPTTDVAVGLTVFVVVTLSGALTGKHFKLVNGDDAEQSDPSAGLLIIRPDDFDSEVEGKVWKELT